MNKITQVIDKYFLLMEEQGGNSYIEDLIPHSMIDNAKESKYEGIFYWNAIPSTLTDADLFGLEKYFRQFLPTSYKAFLKHRHFIELSLGKQRIDFYKNIPNTFVQDTKDETHDCYDHLITKNYLPFATLGDFGIVCFDASHPLPDNDYPIVTFKQEDSFIQPHEYSANFESMFIEFDEYLDHSIKEWFTKKLS